MRRLSVPGVLDNQFQRLQQLTHQRDVDVQVRPIEEVVREGRKRAGKVMRSLNLPARMGGAVPYA